MTDQHVIIMDQVWHKGDYAVDANGELFQLWYYHYVGGVEWYWMTMGTEYDWPVGGTTPVQPLKRAVIKIVEDEP